MATRTNLQRSRSISKNSSKPPQSEGRKSFHFSERERLEMSNSDDEPLGYRHGNASTRSISSKKSKKSMYRKSMGEIASFQRNTYYQPMDYSMQQPMYQYDAQRQYDPYYNYGQSYGQPYAQSYGQHYGAPQVVGPYGSNYSPSYSPSPVPSPYNVQFNARYPAPPSIQYTAVQYASTDAMSQDSRRSRRSRKSMYAKIPSRTDLHSPREVDSDDDNEPLYLAKEKARKSVEVKEIPPRGPRKGKSLDLRNVDRRELVIPPKAPLEKEDRGFFSKLFSIFGSKKGDQGEKSKAKKNEPKSKAIPRATLREVNEIPPQFSSEVKLERRVSRGKPILPQLEINSSFDDFFENQFGRESYATETTLVASNVALDKRKSYQNYQNYRVPNSAEVYDQNLYQYKSYVR